MNFSLATALVLLTAIFSERSHAADASHIYPEYFVRIEVEGKKEIPLNVHCNLIATIESQSKSAPAVASFEFDARMPEHKHGMVTKTKTTKISETQYRIEGVRLHMPGKWLLEFTLKNSAGETKISSPYVLKQ